MTLITHEKIATLLLEIYNNFRWSAIDLRCPANSQNWQIVPDGPAYNQCVISTNRSIDPCPRVRRCRFHSPALDVASPVSSERRTARLRRRRSLPRCHVVRPPRDFLPPSAARYLQRITTTATSTSTITTTTVVQVRGAGGSAPCSDLSPAAIVCSPPPDWIYKVLFYAQITPD